MNFHFIFRGFVDKEDLKEFSEIEICDSVGGAINAAHQRFGLNTSI